MGVAQQFQQKKKKEERPRLALLDAAKRVGWESTAAVETTIQQLHTTLVSVLPTY